MARLPQDDSIRHITPGQVGGVRRRFPMHYTSESPGYGDQPPLSGGLTAFQRRLAGLMQERAVVSPLL